MGTIFNILEVVDRLTKTTQDRETKENKTFREILDEEMKKLNKGMKGDLYEKSKEIEKET